MNQNKPSNTMAIIGLVLGIIAIIFSFIPCVGTLAFLPGVAGAILGVIAYLKAKDNGEPKGMSIAVIVVSLIACAISVFQIFAIGNLASNAKSDLKEYTDCTELMKDYTKAKDEMETLTKELENDNTAFSSIGKIAKMTVKLADFQEQSNELGCNLDLEEDMELIGEEGQSETNEATESEATGEAEGSNEENKEGQ